MRQLLTALLLLFTTASIHASTISFDFSGVLATGSVTDLGTLSAGEPSGTLTFDTAAPNACPGSSAFSQCIDLSSLTLNLPAGSGLSVPSLQDTNVLFAAALYTGNPPSLQDFQINEKSTVDSQVYLFGLYPESRGAFVSNSAFTESLVATDYHTTGASAVPEPSSSVFVSGVLGIALILLRRRPNK